MSKSSRNRKRAKRRRFENSPAGLRKRHRQVVHHIRFCPPSNQWWFSNEEDWAPEICCRTCGLRYTPDLKTDEIVVAGLGRFPSEPTALDLLVFGV